MIGQPSQPDPNKVSVIVRIRNDDPTSAREDAAAPLLPTAVFSSPHTSLAVPTDYCLVPNQQENSIHYFNPPHSASYLFDHVIQGHDNHQLYQVAARDLIWDSFMEGVHCTVLAYGQTASGKTYSMMGTEEQPGILPQSVNDVFEYIRAQSTDKEYLLRVSYLEIYNETIRDLLSPQTSDLRILHDKKRGTHVSPLKEEIVTTPKQVMKIVQRGERNRHYGTTEYNLKSSRSHTVFQMIIECRSIDQQMVKKSGGKHQELMSISQLARNLIDLAGSEKAVVDLERRKEGSYINKSLLTLGNVISKLADEKASSMHIPYRDSKLTRLLQTSLAGDSRISVVCTLNPSPQSSNETLSTLKFATRLKKMSLNPTANIHYDDKTLLQMYKLEIDDLRNRLAEMQVLLTETKHNLSDEDDVELLKAEKRRIEQKLKDEHLVRLQLKERIDHLTRLILTSSTITPKSILDWNAPTVHVDEMGFKRSSVIVEGLLPSAESTPEPISPNRRPLGNMQGSFSPHHRHPAVKKHEEHSRNNQEFYRRHIQEIDIRDEKIKSLKNVLASIRRTCAQTLVDTSHDACVNYEILWKELVETIGKRIQQFEDNNEIIEDVVDRLEMEMEQLRKERSELEVVVNEQQEKIAFLESLFVSELDTPSTVKREILDDLEARKRRIKELEQVHRDITLQMKGLNPDDSNGSKPSTDRKVSYSSSTSSPPPSIPLPPTPEKLHHPTAKRPSENVLVKQFYDLFGTSSNRNN